MTGKVIGIDAGNTRTGGGLTYLSEMIKAAEPERFGINSVVIWGNAAALAEMPERSWLRLRHEKAHDELYLSGFVWQRRKLAAAARREGCNLMFFPGSTYLGNFRPYVAVSQNMLPFSPAEWTRFGVSWTRLRIKLLRLVQARTFRRADGMIFLTQWARLGIESYLHTHYRRVKIVPHGISERFRHSEIQQRPAAAFTAASPFRWLYVSIVAPYKHQWNVARAAAGLRRAGVPVSVDFVGPAYAPSLARLENTLREVDPSGEFLRYRGPVSYHTLHTHYHGANAFIFASSCENMPNILIEAMSAGLPIACSRMGPMPEVLGDGGLYFNPENVDEIAAVMYRLLRDHDLRARCVSRAGQRAAQYSWKRCAAETFEFLASTEQLKNRR